MMYADVCKETSMICYPCLACERDFINPDQLNAHYQDDHTEAVRKLVSAAVEVVLSNRGTSLRKSELETATVEPHCEDNAQNLFIVPTVEKMGTIKVEEEPVESIVVDARKTSVCSNGVSTENLMRMKRALKIMGF